MGTESVFTQDRLKNICELERTADADHAPSTDVTYTIIQKYTAYRCIQMYTVVFYKTSSQVMMFLYVSISFDSPNEEILDFDP